MGYQNVMKVISTLLVLVLVAAIVVIIVHTRQNPAAMDQLKTDSKAAGAAIQSVAADAADATKDTARMVVTNAPIIATNVAVDVHDAATNAAVHTETFVTNAYEQAKEKIQGLSH